MKKNTYRTFRKIHTGHLEKYVKDMKKNTYRTL